MWDALARWTAGNRRRRRQGTGSEGQDSGSLWPRGTLLVLVSSLVLWTLASSFKALPRSLCLEQRCRMSRMWPSYVRYDIPSSTGLDAKYHLFLYREATPGQDFKEPNGRPVIFVPGNAGSYGQVRSLASSTHHLYQRGEGGATDAPDNAEPDWWAVHFNEDFSAFHGETLREEAHYLNDAITFLLALYPGAKSIPIVAHSMGGIVARLAVLEHNYKNDSIESIITLSSPHAYPPVPLDKGVDTVYTQLRQGALHDPAMQRNILLVSLSGGILDDQLSSEASLLDVSQVWPDETSLHGFTSSLAALWSGVDHLAMMWCDQLRERVARGVLRIEGRGKSLQNRKQAWRRILGMPAVSPHSMINLTSDTLSPASAEDQKLEKQTFEIDKVDAEYFEVITSLSIGTDMSFGTPVEQDVVVRVLLCRSVQDPETPCQIVQAEAYDLLPPSPSLGKSEPGAYFPDFPDAELRYEVPGNGLRRLVLDVQSLRQAGISAARVVRVKGAAGTLFAGFTTKAVRRTFRPTPLATSVTALGTDSSKGSGTREIVLEGMDNTLLAYDIDVAMSSAACPAEDGSSPMLVAKSVSTGDTQYLPSLAPGQKHTLMLHGTSPYIQPSRPSEHATSFSVMLDPCSRVRGLGISINWRASLGLLVSRFRTAIVAYPFAVVLAALALLWRDYDRGTPMPSLSHALITHSPLVLPSLFGTSIVASVLHSTARQTDIESGRHLGDSLLNLTFGIPQSPLWLKAGLAMLLWLGSYGLAIAVSVGLEGLTSVLAKVLSRSTSQSARQKPLPGSKQTTSRVPKALLTGSLTIAVAVYLVVPVQFVNLVAFLTQLVSVSTLRAHAKSNARQGNTHAQDGAKQHLLFLNVMFWLLPLNAPALLVWARNLLNGWYGRLGGADHNVITVLGFLLVTYASSSGQEVPRTTSRLTSIVTFVLILKSCLLTVLYGLRYTHMILREANIILLWLSAVWLYARYRGEDKIHYMAPDIKSDEEVDDSLPADTDTAYSNVPATFASSGTDQLPASLAKSLIIDENAQGYDITADREAAPSSGAVSTKLDRLLQDFLAVVDSYAEAQRTLADELSQGAFQLSRAKMHIGQVQMCDRWDARMIATHRVAIDAATSTTSLRSGRTLNNREADKNASIRTDDTDGLRRRRGDNDKKDTSGRAKETSEKPDGKLDGMKKKAGRDAAPYDPLYQYCALPPQALRKSQQHYTKALETITGVSSSVQYDGLVNIRKRLLALERAITEERATKTPAQ